MMFLARFRHSTRLYYLHQKNVNDFFALLYKSGYQFSKPTLKWVGHLSEFFAPSARLFKSKKYLEIFVFPAAFDIKKL